MNRALATVVEALTRVGSPHAVVGSVGATVWGLQRTTIDTDLITIAVHERIDELVASMSNDHTYVPINEARRALRTGGSFNVLDIETTEKIDVFVASSDDSFTTNRLARRIHAKIQGVDTWVTTAEDIVLAKLRWRLSSRSERQWRDCLDIAAINDLDVDYLRRWADVIGVREDLEELLVSLRPLR